jgi:hypothetical protein
MLNDQVYYHGAIRKSIVAFGRLFSDIKIQRANNDGQVEQTIQVPLAYAPKEKWLVRVDGDPSLNNYTYVSLPRMSFEIVSYAYDPTRKTNKLNKITCENLNGTNKKSVFSPAPYNIDISLYIITKTQEDGMQILEQILPIFTPEYTLAVNALPALDIVQDVPVILQSVQVNDEYDGDFQTRRFVTHTLNFQLKTNVYGYVNEQGVITTSNVNLSEPINTKYTATSPSPDDPVTENWEAQF